MSEFQATEGTCEHATHFVIIREERQIRLEGQFLKAKSCFCRISSSQRAVIEKRAPRFKPTSSGNLYHRLTPKGLRPAFCSVLKFGLAILVRVLMLNC